METRLGKISNIRLGDGGYDEAMFGVSVTLSMEGGSTGVQDFKGGWREYPRYAQYTEEDLKQQHADTYSWLQQLMKDAKVREFNQLKGIPVEVITDGNLLKSWRVLTEVL